ncbi:hypothetical protein Lal_00016563 [Lupinus albus]|nr:hypothetical protein Lal_00016563 [Lupinus albus]
MRLTSLRQLARSSFRQQFHTGSIGNTVEEISTTTSTPMRLTSVRQLARSSFRQQFRRDYNFGTTTYDGPLINQAGPSHFNAHDTTTGYNFGETHETSYNEARQSPFHTHEPIGGVHLDNTLAATGRGIYTFRTQGSIYHNIGRLHPNEGDRPRFMQLYIYDTDHELQNRMLENPQLHENVVSKLQHILHLHNPFVHVFRQLALRTYVHQCSLIIKERPANQPQYNLPTTSQVAAIVVVGDVETMINGRDIKVTTHSGNLMRIQETVGYYDPMQYPILFPYGTSIAGTIVSYQQLESLKGSQSFLGSKIFDAIKEWQPGGLCSQFKTSIIKEILEMTEILSLNIASSSLAWKRLVGICSIWARASLGLLGFVQIAYGDAILELLSLYNTICSCSELFNINNVEMDGMHCRFVTQTTNNKCLISNGRMESETSLVCLYYGVFYSGWACWSLRAYTILMLEPCA